MMDKRITLCIVFVVIISVTLVYAQMKGEGGGTAPVPSNATGGGGGGVGNITLPYIDPKVLEELNKTSEIRVIVELRDKSNITINGTKEQRRALSRQRDEWFKPVIDEVLATLSEDEFRIIGSKTSVGFDGYITKKGLDKLSKDERISAIYLDVIVHATDSENETLSKNVSIAEKESEPKIVKNMSELEKIEGLKETNLLWLWTIIVIIALSIIFYSIIKIKKRQK